MKHWHEEIHNIDFEIIEKQILKNYARSLGIFGELQIFFSGSLMFYETTTN
jgi:hypothetical protein